MAPPDIDCDVEFRQKSEKCEWAWNCRQPRYADVWLYSNFVYTAAAPTTTIVTFFNQPILAEFTLGYADPRQVSKKTSGIAECWWKLF